jgi:hypothetical protein
MNNDKYLMLWGGNNYYNNKKTSEPGFWIYSISEVHWNWVKIKGNVESIPHFGYSINYCSEKCFIFGQHKKLNEQKNNSSGFSILNLDLKELDQKLS